MHCNGTIAPRWVDLKLELKIRGMHCHGCASRLERVLERLEQVEAAEANFETESVSVKWTGVTPDRSLIEGAIKKAGFEPV